MLSVIPDQYKCKLFVLLVTARLLKGKNSTSLASVRDIPPAKMILNMEKCGAGCVEQNFGSSLAPDLQEKFEKQLPQRCCTKQCCLIAYSLGICLICQ